MAFYRKLTEGWHLSDGILPECELTQPCGVYEALRKVGYLPDAEQGLNALQCEWIAGREWVYSRMLEMPEEEDERILLELPSVAGRGTVFLNGEKIAAFEEGAVRLELTGGMRAEAENRLEIRFAPVHHVRPALRVVPKIGILCAPILRAVNFATVEQIALSSRMDGEKGIIRMECTLMAHISGKYMFRYALSLDGEAAGMFEFVERLPAARRTICHELSVKQAVRLDRARLDETVYGIKFSLERGGVGCDVRHMETAFRPTEKPLRVMAVQEYPVQEDALERLKEMGAEGIVLAGMPKNAFERNDFLEGLTVTDGETYDVGVGMIREAEMKRYALDEKYWSPDGTLWRLRGGRLPEQTVGGADDFARLTRFVQAARVMMQAQQCRRKGCPMVAQADEDFAYFSSNALIEKSGVCRPAVDALRAVWKEHIAFCELPERAQANSLISMNVWAVVESLRGHVLTARVRVMDLNGSERMNSSFPVMGGDIRLVGAVNLRTPAEAGVLVVRVELRAADGSLVDQNDAVLTVGGANLMEVLSHVGQIELTRQGKNLYNASEGAALSAGLCLMPKESTCLVSREWFNVKE